MLQVLVTKKNANQLIFIHIDMIVITITTQLIRNMYLCIA
jgi:hypothetical protein